MQKRARKALVLLVAPLVVALSACGATSGVVVDRSHTDDYYMYTYTSCGTPQVPMQCPVMTYIPASWSVIVRQDSDGKTKYSDVTESMYNSCTPGKRWVRSTTKDDGYCDQ